MEETVNHWAEGGTTWVIQREGNPRTGNPACTEGLCPHLHRVDQRTMTPLLMRTVHMVYRATHAMGLGGSRLCRDTFRDFWNSWVVTH